MPDRFFLSGIIFLGIRMASPTNQDSLAQFSLLPVYHESIYGGIVIRIAKQTKSANILLTLYIVYIF